MIPPSLNTASVRSILLLLLVLGLFSCRTSRELPRSHYRELERLVAENPVFSRHFTGFSLADAQTGQLWYGFQSEKFFTPASNTKLLTIYCALQILGDSIPALRYHRQGDSLIIWGTGDPTFLHPAFPGPGRAWEFLRGHDGPLFLAQGNYRDQRFGKGWMWDDHNYGFQPEKTAFPIFGNVMRIWKDSAGPSPRVLPSRFYEQLELDESIGGQRPFLYRAEGENALRGNAALKAAPSFFREVPIRFEAGLLPELLKDTLGRELHLVEWPFAPTFARTLYSVPVDSVYRKILTDSDNFLAEQLLLVCSEDRFRFQQTEAVIGWCQDHLLTGLPDPPVWVDGSGLSRYNRISPRDLTTLLHQLYRIQDWKRIQGWMAVGGESGTIRDWFAGRTPFVFAKTGTMANVHCLSGYVLTNSGRVLAFSFMHNGVVSPLVDLKLEMERVLKWIRYEL